MIEKHQIMSISVHSGIKAIGKNQFALIAITLEICFVRQDEVEVVELTWHYATLLWVRFRGDRFQKT